MNFFFFLSFSIGIWEMVLYFSYLVWVVFAQGEGRGTDGIDLITFVSFTSTSILLLLLKL